MEFERAIQNLQGDYARYRGYDALRDELHELRDNHSDLVRLETLGHGADRTPEYPEGRPIEAAIISTAETPEEAARRPYGQSRLQYRFFTLVVSGWHCAVALGGTK
jgi:hypothetical protein